MMYRTVEIDILHTHLESAKQKLSQERADLMALCPLTEDFNREEYAFAYLRAERLGMNVINRRLNDVAWLPMHIDPKAELLGDDRSAMTRWLTAAAATPPDSEDFGNDFIHSLARCGLQLGWTHPAFYKSAIRTANLFRDLSCLIGLVYYGSWLADNHIETVRLSDPGDLVRTAQEITRLIQSPEMERTLRKRAQEEAHNAALVKAALAPPKQKRPNLRLIKTDRDAGLFCGDPVTV